MQRVCVCERSAFGIRCIEREGKRERGKKKGKWGGEEKGGKKRRGKIDIAVVGRFSLMPSVVIARGIF